MSPSVILFRGTTGFQEHLVAFLVSTVIQVHASCSCLLLWLSLQLLRAVAPRWRRPQLQCHHCFVVLWLRFRLQGFPVGFVFANVGSVNSWSGCFVFDLSRISAESTFPARPTASQTGFLLLNVDALERSSVGLCDCFCGCFFCDGILSSELNLLFICFLDDCVALLWLLGVGYAKNIDVRKSSFSCLCFRVVTFLFMVVLDSCLLIGVGAAVLFDCKHRSIVAVTSDIVVGCVPVDNMILVFFPSGDWIWLHGCRSAPCGFRCCGVSK